MKQICLILFLLTFLLPNFGFGQNTFSKRLNFGFPSVVLTSVETNDSCFYICGLVADTLYPYNSGLLFAKYNFEGDLQYVKTLNDTSKTYEAWQNTLIPTSDGNFIMSGLSLDENMKGLLMKLTPGGDTLFLKKFESPYILENPFIRDEDLIILPDKGFASVYTIQKSNFDINILLIRTDSLGQVLWQKIYGGPEDEAPHSIIPTDDGGFIIGAGAQEGGYLFKVDSLGDIEWEYILPFSESSINPFNNLHQLEDESLIVTSAFWTDIGQGIIAPNNVVLRIDSDQELLWTTTFKDSFPGIFTKLDKILPLPDNQHFLAAGSGYGVVNGEWQFLGKLIKASYEGDSIWTRYYHYVENHLAQNLLYDLEATPDGGFIMCGQAKDNQAMPTEPNQQGWLLKVDEHGCLVPGCQLSTSITNEQPPVPFQLKLYPNPVSESLNIYFRQEQASGNAQFRIIDVSGILMQQFDSTFSDVTHIVDVRRYSAGVYFLQYWAEGRLLKTEKFEVFH